MDILSLFPQSVQSYSNNFEFNSNLPLSTLKDVIIILISYLLIIYILAKITPEKGFQLKKILMFHNFFLFILSSIMFLGITHQVIIITKKRGLFDLWCDDKRNNMKGRIYFWLYIFYLSKVYELLDTFFLALKKSKIRLLQVYHHCLTLFVSWLALEAENTNAWIPMINNTGVHVLMYFYYTYHSLTGVRLWFRKYLTMLQMSQFLFNVLAVSFWYKWILVDGYNCSGAILSTSLAIFAMISFFYLFNLYYKEEHRQNRDQKKEN